MKCEMRWQRSWLLFCFMLEKCSGLFTICNSCTVVQSASMQLWPAKNAALLHGGSGKVSGFAQMPGGCGWLVRGEIFYGVCSGSGNSSTCSYSTHCTLIGFLGKNCAVAKLPPSPKKQTLVSKQVTIREKHFLQDDFCFAFKPF